MSYMGNYVIWLEEEGLSGMQHVERYHKENPHMIPPKGERVISTFHKTRNIEIPIAKLKWSEEICLKHLVKEDEDK